MYLLQKNSKVEPVANHVVAQGVINTSPPSPVPQQTSLQQTTPTEVTTNHVGMTINGHTDSSTLNGEHPSINGDDESNGEMEVSFDTMFCI